MRHIPNQYKRKAERASYAAGYRAGFEGRNPTAELRHSDLREMYRHGYSDGQGDKHNRSVDAESAASLYPPKGGAA